jgi:hypothetical protein
LQVLSREACGEQAGGYPCFFHGMNFLYRLGEGRKWRGNVSEFSKRPGGPLAEGQILWLCGKGLN